METQLPLFPGWQPPGPFLTAFEQLAARIVDGINELETLLPEIELPLPRYKRSVRGARTVSIDFIESMIAATDGSQPLQALGALDTWDARAMLQFRAAFRPVALRAIAFGNQINYGIEAWKARVARRSLIAYGMLKQIAGPGSLNEGSSRVATLRHRLGRKNGAKKRRQK